MISYFAISIATSRKCASIKSIYVKLALGQDMPELGIEHAPNDFMVHAVVAVRDIVPRAGNLLPGQLRMPAAQIIGQAFYGFAQDFHQSFAQHLLAPVAAKFLSC